MLIPKTLYGIIGHPLGHTLSPLLHNWGFACLNIPAAYLAFPTPPERLAALVAAVRALPVSGLSVTIPHKEAVMPLLDGLTPLARAAGAVNTLFWEHGRLMGHNTDVEGFTAPLRALDIEPGPALVLGAGGAARAVLAGLGELGFGPVFLTNRNAQRAASLAEPFQARVVPWEGRADVRARLVVNTTPLGLAGQARDESPLPASFWRPGMVAYDLVYNPPFTRFLAEASSAGATIVDGLAMFLAQGAAQFRLWTGRELPREEARHLLSESLP